MAAGDPIQYSLFINGKYLISFLQEADGIEMFSDEEVPTEEMIERMEEKLELATSQQKNLFLIIFQVGLIFLVLFILFLGKVKC